MTSRLHHQLRSVETITLLTCAGMLLLVGLAVFVTTAGFVLRLNILLQIVLLIGVARWSAQRSGTWLNPPLVVISSLFLWHSPVLIGHFFVRDFASDGITFTYGEANVPATVSMISSCMAFFAFGIYLAYRGRPKPIAINLDMGSANQISINLGWAIYAGFALLTVLYLKYEGASLNDDYMSQYLNPSHSAINRVFQSVKYFGVLVILILFYSSKTKRAANAAAVASLALISVNLLFGSRSMPFIYGLTLLICIDKFLWKITAWQLAIILVGASALSFIIDHTRALGVGMNLLRFEQTGRSVDVTHIFVNMGGTVTTVLRTMEFTAGSSPLFGYSFVEPLLFVLPRPLMEAAGIHATNFRPSEWILNYSADVPIGGGLGYSLVAEAFLNFRMFGSVMFLLIGWILSRNCFNHSSNRGLLSDILILNFAILLALHMRNDWAAYFRILFWSYMLIAIIRLCPKKKRGDLILISKNIT